MMIAQREGTSKDLGIDGRTLSHMARRGRAEVIGKTGYRSHRINIWRVYDMELPPTIQAHLRQLRMESGITIDELTEATGLHIDTIKWYEHSDGMPNPMTIYSVLDVLGFRFAELTARIYGKPVPERLPAGYLFPLAEAKLATFAFLAPEHRLPRQHRSPKHCMRYWTADQQCLLAGLDPVEFWREVDSRLRWTR